MIFKIFALFLFLPTLTYSIGFSGTVVISNTPIPIENATITISETKIPSISYTIVSDSKGMFKIDLEKKTYDIKLFANNYTCKTYSFNVTSNINVNLECLLATKITAPKQNVIASRDTPNVSFYNVSESSISRLSEASLFSDTMNSLKLLPGVASKGTFDAEIFIRGGSSYEIVGILDGIPMYDPYLWGGSISIFNSKIAEKVEFYPGGFHAQGGQSLSGILDVYTKDGNFNNRYTELDINLTETNFYHTSPIKEDKSTYMISYKQTYYDKVVGLFLNSDSGKVNMPYMRTFQTKYTSKLNDKHTFKAAFYYFNDGLDIPFDIFDEADSDGFFKYDLKQNIVSLRHDYLIKKDMLNSTILAFYNRDGNYRINVVNDNIDDVLSVNEKNIIFRNDFSWNIGESHHVEFGGVIYQLKLNNGIEFTKLPDPRLEGTVTTNVEGKINEPAGVYSFYLQDTWDITKRFNLRYGLRLETTQFADFSMNSTLDPRLQSSYSISDQTKLITYYGTYSQQIFETNQKATSPTNLDFIPADINMSRAVHIGSGIEHYLTPQRLFKAEIFYKDYSQLPVNPSNSQEVIFDNSGKGEANGFELFIQQLSTKKGEGWMTYTYSKTKRKDNEGWYYPEFDITHMFNMYFDYIIRPKTHIIATLTARNGILYTPILSSGINTTTGAVEYELGPRLSKRLDPYFRVDLWYEFDKVKLVLPIPYLPYSKERFMSIFPQWTLNGSTRVGIYNVTGRKNPIQYYWDDDENESNIIYDFPKMFIFGYSFIF